MSKPGLTLVRQINAPPGKVYDAWIRPEGMARWMGPGAVRSVDAEIDPRVGGTYRVLMRMADGEEHCVGGTYRAIVPGEKLVFTWAWRSSPERESLVTVTFRPLGMGTELTLLHDQFFDQDAADRHRGGWTHSLDRLVGAFAGENS